MVTKPILNPDHIRKKGDGNMENSSLLRGFCESELGQLRGCFSYPNTWGKFASHYENILFSLENILFGLKLDFKFWKSFAGPNKS